jgi:hypothetical protein
VVTRASQKCFSFSTKTAIIQIDNFLVPLFLIPDFATLSFFLKVIFVFATPYKRYPMGEDSLRQKNYRIYFFPQNFTFSLRYFASLRL